MDFRAFKYSLVWQGLEVVLFESQFSFATEEHCLQHYEKGVSRGIFTFDRARINRIWSEFPLWGLIGRTCPVELVRILCAFGCQVKSMEDSTTPVELQKSFQPVTYFIPLDSSEQPSLRYIYHTPLEPRSLDHVPLFLELDDSLVIGSFYTNTATDVDSQLPRFCKLLESDLCLPRSSISTSLFNLFWAGNRIIAQDQSKCVILAERDLMMDIIRGLSGEETLLYLSAS